ncbi:ras-related protein RHN1-like [Coffea eugenioides]|uniref:ras-related protein RHN1-like n=1 Tax=Coffea eugenioides TaxID=49369 RepID=UPI000F614042|nr:ras-related protein RHN1-like [Coffea eugenioides]
MDYVISGEGEGMVTAVKGSIITRYCSSVTTCTNDVTPCGTVTTVKGYFRDFGVGKSSIISRFVNQFVDEEFPDVDRAMLGDDSILRTLEVGGQGNYSAVKVRIFHTNSQERYGALPDSYCRRAAGCIIVYDITSKVSYEGAKTWVEYMKRAASRWDFALPVMALAGNKVDLEDKRQVTTEVEVITKIPKVKKIFKTQLHVLPGCFLLCFLRSKQRQKPSLNYVNKLSSFR